MTNETRLKAIMARHRKTSMTVFVNGDVYWYATEINYRACLDPHHEKAHILTPGELEDLKKTHEIMFVRYSDMS